MQAAPGGDGGDGEEAIFTEINITPLTDVFLVLLIILMVVSTSVIEDEKEKAYEKGLLAERALQVMTPSDAGDQDLVPEDVVISVLPDGTIFIENDEVPRDQLDARLAQLKADNPATRVVLRGDQTASYQLVMDVISACSKSGLNNIALASRDAQ
ncbi:MAG: biopolymer transporter ExbD [Myxococcota bacterium]